MSTVCINQCFLRRQVPQDNVVCIHLGVSNVQAAKKSGNQGHVLVNAADSMPEPGHYWKGDSMPGSCTTPKCAFLPDHKRASSRRAGGPRARHPNCQTWGPRDRGCICPAARRRPSSWSHVPSAAVTSYRPRKYSPLLRCWVAPRLRPRPPAAACQLCGPAGVSHARKCS